MSRAIEQKIADERPSDVPVSLIYNGVDLVRYDHTDPCCTLREEYGLPAEGADRRASSRGWSRRRATRRSWRLAGGAALACRARLSSSGEGSRREELEAQAAALGHRRRGSSSPGRRDDVPAVTAALDVAVLPSYREAQGLTILEAMALSRPVVASAVGGIPEMIEDGRTGLLVPPHDAGALAGGDHPPAHGPPLADMLARGGHDLVHERFCVELMVVRGRGDLRRGSAPAVRLLEVAAAS